MPEEGEIVIASTECFVYYETRYTKENRWEWAYNLAEDFWVSLPCVTAWMPSLKPYKPESEE